MKKVRFRDQELPYWVAEGNHAQYILPIAKKVCTGYGIDVGAGREDWCFPGAMPWDVSLDKTQSAYNIPEIPPNLGEGWDYVFSSHCLEHLHYWQAALAQWTSTIKSGGKLFLYLPHPDCLYWRPEYMPTGKHLNSFYPDDIKEALYDLGYQDVFASERDLSWSFAVFGAKK